MAPREIAERIVRQFMSAGGSQAQLASDIEVALLRQAAPAMTSDWLDEIEAQLDSTVPFYVPRLIAEIRRLHKAQGQEEGARMAPQEDRRSSIVRRDRMSEQLTRERFSGQGDKCIECKVPRAAHATLEAMEVLKKLLEPDPPTPSETTGE